MTWFPILNDKLGHGKCALVMNREVDFGMARALEVLASPQADMEIGVFRSIVEAEEWLEQDASLA